jgi:hypothetical protein
MQARRMKTKEPIPHERTIRCPLAAQPRHNRDTREVSHRKAATHLSAGKKAFSTAA